MKIGAIPALVLLIAFVLMALNAGAPRMLKPDWQLAVSEGDSESYFREFDRNVSPRARQFDLGVGLASIVHGRATMPFALEMHSRLQPLLRSATSC
jgi:hypothetical protein